MHTSEIELDHNVVSMRRKQRISKLHAYLKQRLYCKLTADTNSILCIQVVPGDDQQAIIELELSHNSVYTNREKSKHNLSTLFVILGHHCYASCGLNCIQYLGDAYSRTDINNNYWTNHHI